MRTRRVPLLLLLLLPGGATGAHCSTYIDFPFSSAMSCSELGSKILLAAHSLDAPCAAGEHFCGYAYLGPGAGPYQLRLRHTTRSARSQKSDLLEAELMERNPRGELIGCYARVDSRSEQWELFPDEGRNFCGMAILANATGIAHRITPVGEGYRCRTRRPERCVRGALAPFGVELEQDMPEPVPDWNPNARS